MCALELEDESARTMPSGSDSLFNGKVGSASTGNVNIFERLKAPVAGAPWVNKVFRSGDTKKTSVASNPSAKPKAKGKAKAKAKSASKAANSEDVSNVVEDIQMDHADRRARWWLDDLIACLLHAAQGAMMSCCRSCELCVAVACFQCLIVVTVVMSVSNLTSSFKWYFAIGL